MSLTLNPFCLTSSFVLYVFTAIPLSLHPDNLFYQLAFCFYSWRSISHTCLHFSFIFTISWHSLFFSFYTVHIITLLSLIIHMPLSFLLKKKSYFCSLSMLQSFPPLILLFSHQNSSYFFLMFLSFIHSLSSFSHCAFLFSLSPHHFAFFLHFLSHLSFPPLSPFSCFWPSLFFPVISLWQHIIIFRSLKLKEVKFRRNSQLRENSAFQELFSEFLSDTYSLYTTHAYTHAHMHRHIHSYITFTLFIQNANCSLSKMEGTFGVSQENFYVLTLLWFCCLLEIFSWPQPIPDLI